MESLCPRFGFWCQPFSMKYLGFCFYYKCGCVEETVEHILFQCPFARAICFGSPITYCAFMDENFSISDWLKQWNNLIKMSKYNGNVSFCFASFLCWNIWLAQNDSHFWHGHWALSRVIQQATAAFHEFVELHFQSPS
ncbi:hypothetical protein NE237_016865 [Protea cynaroides]|uniref:Reverse transcriptase zinc-binding domain-containing protein n=1 Tax=Protea cynaroides TaxID=273540 RepID=A0A9Q0HEC5_9MAGN|nr:hypothetical protein NE237_016865 [Protea cynaroides]